jgi:hypothetical protein
VSRQAPREVKPGGPLRAPHRKHSVLRQPLDLRYTTPSSLTTAIITAKSFKLTLSTSAARANVDTVAEDDMVDTVGCRSTNSGMMKRRGAVVLM